jgi:hypothetical protein
MKIETTFWHKIGLRRAQGLCLTCQRPCEARDAETMGAAYFHWAEEFRKELTDIVMHLPVLNDSDMQRALSRPSADKTQLIPSVEELVRTVLRHHRQALVEMARGRESSLDAIPYGDNPASPEIAAVLSSASVESGGREHEQLIARTGLHSFVLYNYPAKEGAEPRIKRAVHTKARRPLTDAHVPSRAHAHHHH